MNSYNFLPNFVSFPAKRDSFFRFLPNAMLFLLIPAKLTTNISSVIGEVYV